MVRNSALHQYLLGLAEEKPYDMVVRTREVDGAVVVGVNLVDHVLQLRLGRVLAQGSHDRPQFLGGDLSYTGFQYFDPYKCNRGLSRGLSHDSTSLAGGED